jgi:hypothetical protein
LSNIKRYGAEEARRNPGDKNLSSEERAQQCHNFSGPFVNGANTDDMNRRGGGEENSGRDRLKKEKFAASRLRPVRVKESNPDNRKFNGHEEPQKVKNRLEGGPTGQFKQMPSPG